MVESRLITADGYISQIGSEIDNGDVIRIIAGGDCGPVRKLEQVTIDSGSDHVLAELLPDLEGADIVMVNLEAPFARNGKRRRKIPSFRTDPDSFALLKRCRMNVASLANNHIFDCGIAGFEQTVALLDAHNVLRCGAGLTLNEAVTPAICERKGIRVGFLAFRETWPTADYPREDLAAGFTAPLRYDVIRKSILELKPRVDWIFLSLHFGWEYQDAPAPFDVRFCRRLIDAGADVVLGHHPHHVQGLECYKGKLIAYSLGNFLWDQGLTGRTAEGILLEIAVSKNRFGSARIIPYRLNSEYAFERILHPQAYERIEELSQVIACDSLLRRSWYLASRNKAIESFHLLFRARHSGERKIEKVVNWAAATFSRRALRAWLSLIGCVLTGRSFYYESQRNPANRVYRALSLPFRLLASDDVGASAGRGRHL